MRNRILFSSAGLILALGVAQARSDGLYPQGTIIGVFSNPILQGYVIHDPTISSPPAYFNNTGTAVYSIVNSTDPTRTGAGIQATGSKLQWGASSSVSPDVSFSELIFFGAQIPSDIHQPFTAGVITYLNGTSDLTSLIFGASLSLYDNFVSPENYLGTDQIIITTTSNIGASVAQDADYINICGNGSQLCGTSIEAFEDSQGGTGVTVNLTGQIVGDPYLAFTSVALSPIQPGTGLSGAIGNQAAMGGVPEPSTWAMMLTGFLGLAGLRYRARRAKFA
jgi:hypothetical protein